jgi:hypothetical protein
MISPARTFRIYSTNVALDPSLVAPTKQFRMQFGSPNLSTANTTITVTINVTWKH